MPKSTNETDYLRLPIAERVMLIHELLDSLPIDAAAPLTPEQITELDRRCEALESGKDPGVPWEAIDRDLTERR